MKVGFDSRPAKDVQGIGRYARCLLQALRDSGRGEIVETHDPRRCDLFHSPWIDGAMLRCPVPMVVTLHDLTRSSAAASTCARACGSSFGTWPCSGPRA